MAKKTVIVAAKKGCDYNFLIEGYVDFICYDDSKTTAEDAIAAKHPGHDLDRNFLILGEVDGDLSPYARVVERQCGQYIDPYEKLQNVEYRARQAPPVSEKDAQSLLKVVMALVEKIINKIKEILLELIGDSDAQASQAVRDAEAVTPALPAVGSAPTVEPDEDDASQGFEFEEEEGPRPGM